MWKSSVSDMVRDISDDSGFVDEVDQHISERNVIRTLIALRVSRGLSQGDIAEHRECSQSKVSKLEANVDRELRLGDVEDYLGAMAMDLTGVIRPSDASLADEVKYHAFAIRKLLCAIDSD